MKRPFLWVFGSFLLFLFFYFCLYGKDIRKKQNPLSLKDSETLEVQVSGILDNIEEKPDSCYLYLKKVTIYPKPFNKKIHLKRLLVSADQFQKISHPLGNIMEISGKLQTFQKPSNPGGFDERAYFREKNIYYRLRAESLLVKKSGTWPFRNSLYSLKERLKRVYALSLPTEDSSIISAMLLGEKSDLPTEVRKLYQTGGISHLLAISGLHISILCMAFYRGLGILHIPGKVNFCLTFFFLLCYGSMTGFHISTNRAIIMMLLYLFSREIRRSYDPATAMALSAGIILLQTPYALFSPDFLLSFSAVCGIYFFSPVMKCFFYGSCWEQEKRKRREKRRQRALEKHFRLLKLLQGYYFLRHLILTSLSSSLCVTFFTLPVLAYFYYEIPVYGILMNIIVLPFAGALVVFALSGGITGLFFLPLAQIILIPVHLILELYQFCCECTGHFPEPVYISGRPGMFQILGYLLILVLLILLYEKIWKEKERVSFIERAVLTFALCLAFVILTFRPAVKGVSCTMLDVGQGDGMVLQTESGHTVLIDGGSSSVSNVGEYRILPFLKYHGIRHIDYIIMTHEDEDHISGQLELIKGLGKNGLSAGTFLFPEPSMNSAGENYEKMKNAVKDAGVSFRFIHSGDTLTFGALKILCLHPDKNFEADSANAYSTTLLLTYLNFSMLLTGDLEKNGEEAVMEKLFHLKAENRISPLTVLKVAHHGSKNSTPSEMLRLLSPEYSIISCGRKNRYGHPHKDLLERLNACGTRILRTDESGAVFIQSDGNYVKASSFL